MGVIILYLCRVPVFSTVNLAGEVLESWFDLGLELEVPEEKLIQIRDDNKAWQTEYDKASKMLETWRNMGCSSTYEKLGDALRRCGKGILAEKYFRSSMEPVPPTETARALVEKGVGVNTRDEDGITPLHFAARTGKTERVKALVEKVGYRYARDNLAGLLSISPPVKEKQRQ